MKFAPAALPHALPLALPLGVAPVLPRALKRRSLVTAAGALLAAPGLALVGCSPSGPVRIGYLGGLTGRVADLGVGGRNGAQMAIDDLNAAGGVKGRLLELVAKDDEQKPEVARARLKELAAQGIGLVIGPMTSLVAVAVRAYAGELGLVLVSPTASAPELVHQTDALFCLAPNAVASGAQHAEHLYRLGYRSLSTLAELQNKSFSQSWAEGAQTRFAALGGRRVLDTTYTSAPGVSYGDIAQQLLAARSDVVMLIASTTDTAVLAQQLRRRDDKVALTTTAWAAHEQLLQTGGRAIEGMTVAQLLDRSSRAAGYLQFVARYKDRFGDVPGYRSVNAYDAVQLAAQALRAQHSGQSLSQAMRGVRSHPGLQHTVTLDEYGDSIAPLYLTQVQNGQFVAMG